MFLIPTVQHTGTHFVCGLFGVSVVGAPRPGMESGDPNEVIWEHVERQTDTLVELASKHPTIIPLRHPKVLEKSWLARNKSPQKMCRDYRIVVERLDPLNPYYLPIDVENRQDYLDKINVGLGTDLKTEWVPAGVKKKTFNLRHEDMECGDMVAAFCDEIKPFLDRFY